MARRARDESGVNALLPRWLCLRRPFGRLRRRARLHAVAHHCPCCASVWALPPRAALPERRVVVLDDEEFPRPTDRGPPCAVAKPDLRPPIA